MPEFKRVLKKSDLKPGTGKTIEIDGTKIAVFNVGNDFYAIDDTCVHRGGPLGEGALHGKEVSCPWHGWEFDVTTGKAFHAPEIKVRTYPVKVENNDILISIY